MDNLKMRALRLVSESQLGDGVKAIPICSQRLDRLLARIGNRLAGIND